MNRYKIQAEDQRYLAEFLDNPLGYHTPGLQRVLNLMRGGALQDKYVLVTLEPNRRWALAQLPGVRGEPVRLVAGVEYGDRLDAERDVFLRRWRDLGGADLREADRPC